MTATAARGWRRPVSGTAEQREELLEQARQLGAQTEAARQLMLGLAARRHRTIQELYDLGMSVRELAAALGVSAPVVQAALRSARATPNAG